MGNAIVNGILSGIEGGAKAQQGELVKDAAQIRKNSYAKLLQEYARDNIELQNRLGIQRDELTHNRNVEREDDIWKRDTKRDDEVYARNKKDARELVDYQNSQEDKRGQYGKMYDDLARVFGDEKAKSIMQASMTKKEGGTELSAKDKANFKKDAFDMAISEMQMDIAKAKTDEEKQRISAAVKKRAEELYSEWTGEGGSSGSGFAAGLITEATSEGGDGNFTDNIKKIFGSSGGREEMPMQSGHGLINKNTAETVKKPKDSGIMNKGKTVSNYADSLPEKGSDRDLFTVLEKRLQELRSSQK